MEATTPEFEAALDRLLQSYSAALKTAGDLPAVGRCRVWVGEARVDELDEPVPPDGAGLRHGWRWVARFPTRLYVETHVRRQLRHLARCLDDELLAVLPANGEDRLAELREYIGQRTGRLLSWATLRDFLVRIPPVAAFLPLVTTALGDPSAVTSRDDLVRDLLVLAVSALLVYLLFVWPSVRLGFRVKRAIFSGGIDQAHPFLYKPGKAVWRGVPAPRPIQELTALDRGAHRLGRGIDRLLTAVAKWRSSRRTAPTTAAAESTAAEPVIRELTPTVGTDTATDCGGAVERVSDGAPSIRSFPATVVYRDENVVFALLGRRKRVEPPLGLLLSIGFYLIVLLGLAMPFVLIDYFTSGDVEAGSFVWICAVTILVELIAIQFGLQAWRNYRAHLRRWGDRPAHGGR